MKYVYDHMEELDGVQFPDFKKYSGNLIVYGAGTNGALCAFALQELGVDFLCYCDGDTEKQGRTYIDHPVLSIEECRKIYPNAAVLFDAYALALDLEKLYAAGYSTILFPASLFLGMDCSRAAAYITEKLGYGGDGYFFREAVDAPQVFEWIDEYMVRGIGYANGKKNMWRSANLDITDRCTLRCKNCLSFKAYFSQPKHTPWEELELVVDRLIDMHWFRRFHILGGEPLLYPQLDKLVQKLTAVKEVEHIVIITNGTIIPTESALIALQNPKVMLRISYYGSLSSHYQQLEHICIRNGINVRVHAQRWTDVGRPLPIISEKDETQQRFDLCNCGKGGLVYVLHGKATLCPFAANTESLGLFQAERVDYVDLTADISTQNMFEQLNTLYWKKMPLQACYYCNGWLPYGNRAVPVAEQYEAGERPKLPTYGTERKLKEQSKLNIGNKKSTVCQN